MIETVAAAAITAGGVVAAAWIPTRALKKRVGSPNGSGNVIEMLEATVESLGELKGELRAHTTQDAANFRAIEDRLAGLSPEENR